MKQDFIETIVGFFIITVAICFFAYAYKSSNVASDSGYVVSASFQNVDGINVGSDIMIAGIKVGSVDKIVLDQTSFFAILSLRLNEDVKVPLDSQASIVTTGILGGRVVSITPGMSDVFLTKKGQIKYTQSAINIETLIGKFMYSFGNKKP